MTTATPAVNVWRRSAAAFTLAETLVSTVIIGVLLVAALNTVGAAQVGRQKTSDRVRGQLLAHELMAEILTRPYDDPDETGPLGLDLSDLLGPNRLGFDDLDDYHGLSDSPPAAADGAALDGFDADWERTVAVTYVEPANPNIAAVADAGAKRVTIEVKYKGGSLAQLSVVRTRAWQGGATQ